VTNEDGKFLESAKTYVTLLISSVGFSEKEITLDKAVNYNFKIQLSEAESLNEVVVLLVKLLKKNNPALDILRKIWERKRKTVCLCTTNTKWKSTKNRIRHELY
jgi:hypothetical protein